MADKTETDTTTADDAGHADDGGSLDARMGKLEATQAEQDSKLDRILELLPGKSSSGGGDDTSGAGGGQGSAAPDVQSQVRAEIAAAKARQEDEDRRKGDEDWRQSVEAKLEELRPEKTPREAQTGWRGRLQSVMFGKPDD